MVSVALCTHNGAEFIVEQLESIVQQTHRPSQLVVSDDASSDETVSIVEAFWRAWSAANPGGPELLVLKNETPLGVTANFEQALTACSHALIALCDQDDVWPVERIEKMVGQFSRRPDLELVHTDARLVDATGAPLGTTLLQTLSVSAADRTVIHDGRAFSLLLRRNLVTGATVMLRRELVKRARPFPLEWVHDEWLAMVAASTGHMDLLDEPLTDYRQHGRNQIGVTSLDASGRLGRLTASRSERNARLLARAEVLCVRAPNLRPQPRAVVLRSMEDKLKHEQRRSNLPGAPLLRVWPILTGLCRGDYHRYGLGLQDVLRDLVQPV